MIVLGIETCSPSGGAALFDGDRVLAAQSVQSSRAHSRLILPAIRRMLGEFSIRPADLGAVAVSQGPGSFTGVRVGLTLGKALCENGSPPLVLVSTLHALALRSYSGEQVDCVVPLLNARRGEIYGAVYSVRDALLGERILEDFVCAPADLEGRVTGRALVSGEGARAWRNELPTFLPGGFIEARKGRLDPSAEEVAIIGHKLAESQHFVDPARAEPVYLRPASVSTPKQKGDAG